MRNWNGRCTSVERCKSCLSGCGRCIQLCCNEGIFPGRIESFSCKNLARAMEAVVEGRADYAVLPIENTTAGIVADIYDLLTEYELSIVGEQIIRPEHVLLGLPDAELEDIRQVCSHPQHFPSAENIWKLIRTGRRKKWKILPVLPRR